jgi:hypothetical protein
MGKFGNLAKSVGDTLGKGLKSAQALARSEAVKNVAKAMDDAGDDLAKVDPKVFLKAGGKGIDKNALDAFTALLRAGDVPKKELKKLGKTMSEAAKGLTDKEVMDAAGESLGKTGKALKDSKSFWEKNKTAFLAAGVSAVGIALATMIAGKKPEEVTGVLKSGDKTDPKDEDDEDDEEEDDEYDEDGKKKPRGPRGKAGLVEFFKKYGSYIGIALGFLIFLGVIVFVMSRKSNNTNAPVEPTSV